MGAAPYQNTPQSLRMKYTYPAYGALGFSLSIIGIPLFMYLPVYYVSRIGLDIALVGAVLLIARILDMLLDPIIGFGSDRLCNRKGFIVWGGVLLLMGYYAMIHPILSTALWLFGTSMIVYIGWSLISVPYMALSSEISPDYHEKTTLASWREIFALSGMMSALSIPYLLGVADKTKETLDILFLLLLASLPLSIGWLIFGVKRMAITPEAYPFFKGLALIFKSNTCVLIGGYFLNALANAIPSTLFLYYVSHILNAPQQSGLLLILYFFSGVAALPIWTWTAKRHGKKKTWIASMLLASSAFAFVPLLGSGDVTAFMAIVIVSGFSLGADLVLSTSLQSDAAQKYSSNGKNLSGVLFGLWGMGTKLALAFGVGISFGLLGLAGFTPHSPSQASLDTLIYLYGLAPVVLKLLAIITLWRYKETN